MNNNPHLLQKNIAGSDALVVFENFQIDRTLPKYAVTVQAENSLTGIGVVWGTNASSVISGTGFVTVNALNSGFYQSSPPVDPLFVRLWKALTGKAQKTRESIRISMNTVPVQEMFEAILGSGKKLEILEGRLETHHEAIKEARSMGQIALAEQLEKRTKLVEAEAVLFAAGHREFIEEKDLVQFVKTCERGLRLDYLKNFTRLIPQDVRARKTRMDTLKVFDCYVVLHFDPDSKGAAMTAKEIEKKKDPILFGLVEGSRRLYHVGSWVDEHCNLTFGDLIDKFGKETLRLK